MDKPTEAQRVEKLVEWVAEVIETNETEDLEPPYSIMPRGGKVWAKIKAKRILFNPDFPLALIVEKELPDLCEFERKRRKEYGRWEYLHGADKKMAQDYESVISITERTQGDMLKWHKESVIPLTDKEVKE